jgi:hypothetical protein
MTKLFVQAKVGKETSKSQVSIEGCTFVDDYREAIQKKFPHLLGSFPPSQLTLSYTLEQKLTLERILKN